MNTATPPACLDCKHWHREASPPACDAYPALRRIPDAIWTGHNQHTGPVEGDRGIRFEPIEGCELQRALEPPSDR